MDFSLNPRFCPTDVALLEEFAASTEAYFDAVKGLHEAGGSDEIMLAFELTEMARRDCATARERVERHRTEHGCRTIGTSPPPAPALAVRRPGPGRRIHKNSK